MRRSAGLAASFLLCALSLAGCGHGTVITGGPLPTPTPTVPKVTNEFSVPAANSSPGGILSSSGYLFFTEQGADKIGQVSTGGSFTEYAIVADGATAGDVPVDLVAGPGNLLWFTEQGPAPGIASFAPGTAGATVTEYAIAGSKPTYIINGPVPNTLAFSDPGHNAIGQITSTGTVTETAIPTANAGPMGLAVLGSTQKIYFAEHDASKIGILDTATNTITEVPTLTPNAGPTAVVAAQDGAIWFTENNAAKLGRLSPTGAMSEYPLTPATSATGLVQGADNYFYFMDPAQNKIGRISLITPGAVTEYDVPTAGAFPVPPSFPGALVVGADARIYFTEPLGNKIGQLTY